MTHTSLLTGGDGATTRSDGEVLRPAIIRRAAAVRRDDARCCSKVWGREEGEAVRVRMKTKRQVVKPNNLIGLFCFVIN